MTDAVIRYLPTARTLSIGDNALHFGHTLTRYLVRNNSLVSIFVAADATASLDSTEVESFDDLIVDGDVTVLHVYSTVELGLDDLGLGEVEVVGWAPLEPPGDLRQAGTYDPAGAYGSGDVVTDGGGLYTCTAPVVPDTRVDTFERPDQDGWGTASDGHIWQQITNDSDGDGTARLVSGHAQLGAPQASDDGSLMLLGPALNSADVEMHARFVVHSVSDAPGGERPALVLRSLGSRPLGGTYVWLWTNGEDNNPDNVDLAICGVGTQVVYSAQLAAPRVSDAVYQVRLRHVGLGYQLRVWADADTEPTTWDLDVSVEDDALGGRVGVHQQANDDTEYVAFTSFSATTLAPAPALDPEHWTALAPAPAQAGTPVLYGPYVVDYTDIPHDGNKKTLWVPQVGDVLLRLFPDSTGTGWDFGSLFIGQNVNGTVTPPLNVIAVTTSFGNPAVNLSSLDNLNTAEAQGAHTDGAGVSLYASAYVFHTTDPIQIQLAQTGGSDPSAGHVEIYALVARPVSP